MCVYAWKSRHFLGAIRCKTKNNNNSGEKFGECRDGHDTTNIKFVERSRVIIQYARRVLNPQRMSKPLTLAFCVLNYS